MTLNEYLEKNGNKEIEVLKDGTLKILESGRIWKPKYNDLELNHEYPKTL